jgi:hypothetical protein
LRRLHNLLAATVAISVWPLSGIAGPCGLRVEAHDPAALPDVRVLDAHAVADLRAHGECQEVVADAAKLAVVISGSFRSRGEIDVVLARLAAVSLLPQMRYWSVSDGRWEQLVLVAAALATADGPERPDFTADELRDGEIHYYRQKDNRSSNAVVYDLRVQATSASASVEITNVTPLRYLFFVLFPPRNLHTYVQLRRRDSGLWDLLVADSFGPDTSRLALGHEASFVNRTAATFRHLAGIPTDTEPPMAR